MSWSHVIILSPFILAVFVPLFYKYFRAIHTGWFVLLLPILLFSYLISLIPQVSEGEAVLTSIPWIPSLGIDFTVYIDGLGLLFALLITGIGALVVLYSIYYLSKETEALHSFYVYLLMFMGAMLGVVLSDNLIILYLFWEFTSLSSFLLIAYWHHREKSRYGAQKSMLITVFGGLSMLGGFVLLYLMSGTFSIREILQQLDLITLDPLFLPAMLLVLVGAFTKSAQFPFHIWLPDAMEAPTPVSAYLHSATMVKAGIYLVARMSPIFAGNAEWFWLVGGFGLVTLFWGSFSAVKQTDLKSILAFSTVSQLGMIMCLLGLGSAALYYDMADSPKLVAAATVAAVFHLINHATFKGALFMVAGIVDHETGTRDIRKLGGLIALMPITFTLAVIGTFSMAGVPPFNGFLSKEMFFTGVLGVLELDVFNLRTWGLVFPVVAWTASVFTFVYSMIIVFRTFGGKLQLDKLDKKPHEAPLGMLISPVILASLVIVFGFFPNILSYTLIEPAVASIMPSLLDGSGEYEIQVEITHWHGWNTELLMTIGVIIVGTLLYLGLKRWTKLYDYLPKRLTLNKAYDGGLVWLERGSFKLNQFHMSGFVRDYLVYIFAFMIIVLGSAMLLFGGISISTDDLAPIAVYEVLVAMILIAAALSVIFTSSRLIAIISVGVVGYVVALLFVIFRAPDLALTQLVVETISVALFLLCFYHLPVLKKKLKKLHFRAVNFVISVGVGVMVTLLALFSQGINAFDPISKHLLDTSYTEAGGKNVVNVILVDFRGFDTLLEILVLGIASLGVYALIKLRMAGSEDR